MAGTFVSRLPVGHLALIRAIVYHLATGAVLESRALFTLSTLRAGFRTFIDRLITIMAATPVVQLLHRAYPARGMFLDGANRNRQIMSIKNTFRYWSETLD